MIGDNAQSRDILSVLILAPVHTGEKLNIGVVWCTVWWSVWFTVWHTKCTV